MKTIAKWASICFAAVSLVALAAAGLTAALAITPSETFSEPVIVNIEPGTGTRAIAGELESRGVISSRWLFFLMRGLRPRATLMAGEYQFEQPMSAWEAFRQIAEGRILYHRFTVPEGFNRFEVADAVGATGFIGRDEFLELTEDPSLVSEQFPDAKNLEGFLFPDTYYVARSVTPPEVVEMMISRFREVFGEIMESTQTTLEPYEIVKLASLVEKETSIPAEHGLVSSVFHNRLRRNMLLQCDPTVIYGLILENRYRGQLTLADLEDPHGYNTYVHPGLPPGPIANPGREALRAAANPAQSDFLYFVAEPNGAGGHVFSKSLGAHNRAVSEYRRSRAR